MSVLLLIAGIVLMCVGAAAPLGLILTILGGVWLLLQVVLGALVANKTRKTFNEVRKDFRRGL